MSDDMNVVMRLVRTPTAVNGLRDDLHGGKSSLAH